MNIDDFAKAFPDTEPFTWGEPQALPAEDAPAPVLPFDLEALPERFRPWVEDVAHRIQCPIEYPAAAAMATAGAALCRGLGIRPKPRGEWVVFPNLWAVLIGRPSDRKSPPLGEMLAPLRAIEDERRQAWEAGTAEAEAARASWEIARDAWKGLERENARKAFRAGETWAPTTPPEEPRRDPRPRMLTTDGTMEKLVEMLVDNPRGITLERDELAGFFATLTRAGREGERQFWLTGASGTEGFAMDRIGRGSIHCPPVCLGVIGTIQPAVLESLTAPDAVDDGLAARFGLAVWPNALTGFERVDTAPDATAREAYAATIRRLAEVNTATGPKIGTPGEGAFAAATLTFTPEAAEMFGEWEAALMRRLRGANDLPAKLEAHLGKAAKTVAALAMLTHLADGGTGDVGTVALGRALLWAEILESHAARIYGAGARPEVKAARRILEKLRAGDLPATFTARDIYRHEWTGLATPEATRPALEVLEGLGWIRRAPAEPGPGRPPESWEAHPHTRPK